MEENFDRDRRQTPRYKMIDVAAVVGERRLGHVLDMSVGGMAFSYLQMQREDLEEIELGIIFGQNGQYLDKLPVEIISDSILSHGPVHHPVVVRRRSLRFVDLDDEQMEKLREFIRAHAKGSL
ncbi:MAG: PilZ domain-containing protein [Thermodesulfobacteriota bacterium]